uniref:Rho guanine nucleotide exchange factor (GEF) 40 n=1 Tax=Sander lucioperca TaxID=283035 RepID=A0A8C9X5P9_SANLU
MEDCVQGALSSLYPPFESTAPPLLSQVFSVLESTYQHDSLRYLLDYFVPAKHLLHKLQQHACSQYLGCLFLHSGWPLCLGEKVVIQLSTLDWRILRSNDFYLQVVPFSTRCPRLALKCLAPGGRTVQEILVPESQHPLVFTAEWLHSVNKERVGGGLDTCLVSTCDGVIRLPWKEVVYPKFIHDPSEELGLMSNHEGPTSNRLPSEGGSNDGLSPDGLASESALPRRRRSEDGLGRTARHPQLDGDYVELLEPRVGPDGGVDTKQRYLEMHGICKTKTLPLCRRGKAIKLRKGRAWGYGRLEGSGSFRAVLGAKRDVLTPKGDILPPRPPPAATEPVIQIINCLLYLISTFLCFVFRRKRKGKGAKGRARSGGRTHQKGSKHQGKAAQPSPTTCSALTKLPTTEENQRKQADEPDGVPPSINEGTEDTRKSSAGLREIEC